MSDYFKKYVSLFSTTLSSSISTGTGETITFASVTNVPTDTEITITIDRVDSSGNATPTKMERITGTLSGSNLTSYTRGIDNSTQQAHSSGAVVEMVWNAADWNSAITGLLVEHKQTGGHKNITASNITASATTVTTLNIGASTLVSSILDDSTMSANSASALVTQQSVKSHVASGTITMTNKTLTSPVINTQITGTAIATGAEVTTGTDDTQIVTPKALGDAGVNTRLKSKVLSHTRYLDDASGDVAYTGYGFTPKALQIMAAIAGASYGASAIPRSYSIGFVDTGLTGGHLYSGWNGLLSTGGTYIINIDTDGTAKQLAIIKSLDSDGFTLTWTKQGSGAHTLIGFIVLATG